MESNNASSLSGIFGGDYRLVVESVGRADAAVIGAVQQIVRSPTKDVAKLIYQAPSELASGLMQTPAREIAGLLRQVGLDVRVLDENAEFQSGTGEFEVSMAIRDVEQIPAIIREITGMLGVDVSQAQRIVCACPAVLLAQVSEATVHAVRERLRPYSVEVDASRSAEAEYYAVLIADSPSVMRMVRQILERIPDARVADGDGALTVSGLTEASAKDLWEQLQRTGTRTSICNRDLARYDVQLEAGDFSEGMARVLGELGIPEAVVPRLLARLPIVIQQNVSHAAMESTIARLAEHGGRASGLPLSFQRFGLALQQPPDREAAVRVLKTVGAMKEVDARAAVESLGDEVGNFTKTQAAWLRFELERVGCKSSLVKR